MPSPQVEAFIKQWHRIFAEDDPTLIYPMIDDDVEFYSPAIFTPKRGKETVFELLGVVYEVFEDYRVTDTWTKDNEVMFEFEVKVGKFSLQGIDRFRLNDDGKVAQLKVWIRPLSGLQELARQVAKRGLEAHLADHGPLGAMLVRAQVRSVAVKNAVIAALK